MSKNEKKQLSSSLLIRKNENYELYGKTGTGIVNGKYNNGWFVGYVITNHDKYYFSTHLSDEKASGENAKLINEKIFKRNGCFKWPISKLKYLLAEWDVMNLIWNKKSVSANEIVVEFKKIKKKLAIRRLEH